MLGSVGICETSFSHLFCVYCNSQFTALQDSTIFKQISHKTTALEGCPS
ncbi:unnamed protein product [Acanthoscelides obtectus]|uniref:Uncharacterized protein n=1 Tax=Acanthoscelides obtectus TaxID=200917 RepID=A0A9P0MAR4_ACAOB|nr:unnamed protein product [Acanthoscelides obtectus]CAK1643521.1 hypothetical protein AOBTE_LOCUS13560 [Acanthoscelides obtectus]